MLLRQYRRVWGEKYLFIPLDIFREKMHNKPIENKVDAWLAFFSMDEPESIVRLIEAYPDFLPERP